MQTAQWETRDFALHPPEENWFPISHLEEAPLLACLNEAGVCHVWEGMVAEKREAGCQLMKWNGFS